MKWQSIKTAPKDRAIIVRTRLGACFEAEWESHAFLDKDGKQCGGWVACHMNTHPECWTDGVCWDSNENEKMSDQPVLWMESPELPSRESGK